MGASGEPLRIVGALPRAQAHRAGLFWVLVSDRTHHICVLLMYISCMLGLLRRI